MIKPVITKRFRINQGDIKARNDLKQSLFNLFLIYGYCIFHFKVIGVNDQNNVMFTFNRLHFEDTYFTVSLLYTYNLEVEIEIYSNTKKIREYVNKLWLERLREEERRRNSIC